jgi:hypothetical protein
VTQVPRLAQILFGLDVILLNEPNDSQIVFESCDVCLWELILIRHLRLASNKGLDKILRQTDRSKLKVRLKAKSNDIVDTPFPRFAER